MGYDLADYVTVAARVALAYDRWPELRIQTDPPIVVGIDGKTFLQVTATVWRDPDDPLPARATAWEPFPGATPYTRDSEMMNCETSAVGRALGFMGILAEKIASENEVRSRRQSSPPPPASPPADRPRQASSIVEITDRQAAIIRQMAAERGVAAPDDLLAWSAAQASDEIARLKDLPRVR